MMHRFICSPPEVSSVMTAKAFAEGFMTDISTHPYDATFLKTVCSECNAGFFGTKKRCENCASEQVERATLAERGEIHTYTVQRFPPPEPYRLGSTDRDEWEPQPVAYVDLEEVRVIGLVDADPEHVEIGNTVEIAVEPGWQTDDDDDVLIYKFVLMGDPQ